MNPDFQPRKTTGHITWTLNDSKGNVITFKVQQGNIPPHLSSVEVTDENGKVGNYLLVAARNMWDEYIRQGFTVQNKCIHHDMDNFYDKKRWEEKSDDVLGGHQWSKMPEYKKQPYKYKKRMMMEFNYALEA
jgi:hypothetical protein